MNFIWRAPPGSICMTNNKSICYLKIHVVDAKFLKSVKIHVKCVKMYVECVKICCKCENVCWKCEKVCWRCEILRCEFPVKLTLTFDLESWPWTWPLFHRYFWTQTIYYSTDNTGLGLFVLETRLSFHGPHKNLWLN